METNYNPWPKWLVPTLGTALIVFVGFLAIEKAYSVFKSISPSKPENTMSISAEGRVTARPDMATINLGVYSKASTAKAAQDDATNKLNKVIAFIKSRNIADEDIVTSGFSVYPVFDYTTGKQTIAAYQANQTVTIKVKKLNNSGQKVGEILEGASENGANEIQGVSFGFEDADNLRQEARKQAIAKAKEKAQELAAEAGIRLGKVVSVSENNAIYPVPMYYDKTLDARGGAGTAPDVQTGSQEITQSVTVVFEIK